MAETFVFVHGAWLGAWCWDLVRPILEAKGHRTLALDLPGHGRSEQSIEGQDIHTYAAYIAQVLRAQSEPVILVAHSMGGMSVSEAACMVPEKVKKIVYVTAFLPKDGQSNNYCEGDPNGIQPMDWKAVARSGPGVNMNEDETVMWLDDDMAIGLLYNDLPEDKAKAACKNHGKETVAAPYTRVSLTPDFDTILKYYVRCTRDNILTPDIQDKMLRATPVVRIYDIDSGHCPYLSRPEELAGILAEIAEA